MCTFLGVSRRKDKENNENVNNNVNFFCVKDEKKLSNGNAEHFRELSVLGKRTGAAIGLCKSRNKVTGRRRRR